MMRMRMRMMMMMILVMMKFWWWWWEMLSYTHWCNEHCLHGCSWLASYQHSCVIVLSPEVLTNKWITPHTSPPHRSDTDFLEFYLQGLRSDVAVSSSIEAQDQNQLRWVWVVTIWYYWLLLPFHTSPHHDHFQPAPWHLLLRISTWNHNGFHVGSPPDAMSIHDGSTIQVRRVRGDQTCRYPSVERTHRYSTTKCPTPVFIASIW